MEIQVQHYAFLVSEKEFDQIIRPRPGARSRLLADPGRKEKGRINRPLRRPRRLLQGPERPPARDHYADRTARRVITADLQWAHSPSSAGKKGRTMRKLLTATVAVARAGVFGFSWRTARCARTRNGQRRCAADHQGRRGNAKVVARDHYAPGAKAAVQGGVRVVRALRAARCSAPTPTARGIIVYQTGSENQRAGPAYTREERRQKPTNQL